MRKVVDDLGWRYVNAINVETINENNKTMNNEFVTYEQALAVRELGLNIDNYLGVYGLDGRHLYNVHGNKFDVVDEMFFIKAPLKQQVFRWLSIKLDMPDLMIPVEDLTQNTLIDKLISELKSKHLLL